MYSYDDIESIKTNLEWIVHQSMASHKLLTPHDQNAIFNLLELIQTYEALLESINTFGISVIDENIAEGLFITESLIAKVKRPRDAI
ncbi:hypothetical protein ACJVQT_03425 [Enterobacter huaxiensis]|jgi:hypothetical protein|uniref:hypothetical protein n=1 Tax=Enterobacter huaxiensis TaxID=2494702 RepID=UPI00217582A0|nr:hypothetical protein [Enterobacter huaxiensis]MCS5451604.1 hypothetical protein [Enterobacter huaxiensis]